MLTLAPMVVEILHVPDCPNVELVRERLEHALDTARALGTIRQRVVATAEDAGRLGMRGSPTILVDGIDLFTDTLTSPSLSCRLFSDTGSPAAAPSFDELVAAFAARHTS